MVGHFIWRGFVVVVSFLVVAGVALALLFALGSIWVGDELRTIAAEDPQFQAFIRSDPVFQDPAVLQSLAMAFGAVVFIGTVGPALTALPAFAAAIAGEVLRVRSWMYYVLAGGAALAAIPLLAGATAEAQALPASEYMTIFATAGFAGGLIYWLLAGRGA
ncbi:MAG: hypothetical protein QNJ62_03585 [Methyloceanibacter sp.]|nr:hypothetical protein [Methyloceanibacter sp.]